MQRGDAVDGLEAAARRHHVEAVAAVTRHVQVVPGVSVLHHHDEAGPPVGQVVAGHALAPLRSVSRHRVTAASHRWRRSGGKRRYLVSFSPSLRQLDDGVGDGGAAGAHLLHHHQSAAVNHQHVSQQLGSAPAGCGHTAQSDQEPPHGNGSVDGAGITSPL